MVYIPGISSPVSTDFFLAVGATEFDFGLLCGVPMIMLSLQFLGAFAANYTKKRKPWFMVSVILSRLMYLPVAFLPLLFPNLGSRTTMKILITLISLSGAMVNFTGPMWSSWMADVSPHRVLNTYWGTRQRWMSVVSMTASLVIAASAWFAQTVPITVLFPIMVTVAVTAGVTDILLFLWIKEPPNTIVRDTSIVQTFMAPFRHPEYRTFLAYSCAWSASTMFAAAFMLPYTLKVLGMRKDLATLIWCVGGIGVAMSAKQWGRIADKHGQKPVLAFCTYFKFLVVIVFLLVTKTSAVWLLPLAFLFDGTWNTGNGIATNGYMMKLTPKENRSMFFAAQSGITGICGGLSAIASGWLLQSYSWFELHAFGRTWINYHIIFLMSLFMRIGCIAFVPYIREPKSSSTTRILDEALDVWPMNVLRFPIDLYRKHLGNGNRSNND